MDHNDEKYMTYMRYWWFQPGIGQMHYQMSMDFERLHFRAPSLDLSCGDGTFAFMALDGQFTHDTDSITPLTVLRPPRARFDLGADILESSLIKSKTAGIYEKTLLHDNNVTPLPVEDGHFNTIYCNAVYWVREPIRLLEDIHRMLAPGGEALLHVITPAIIEHYETLKSAFDPALVDHVNRFLKSDPPTCYDYAGWKALIDRAGFEILHARSTVRNRHMLTLCNVEYRLVLEELYSVMTAIDPELRSRVKASWVGKVAAFFRPMMDKEPFFELEESPYVAFHLQKP